MSDHEARDERPLDDEPLRPATRVDPAHVRSDALVSAASSVSFVAEPALVACGPVGATEQIRLQASQLASHLRRQQSAVDHREAELNARLASMENQLRAARLWLDERHAELAERNADIDRREQDLRAREEQMAGATTASAKRSGVRDATELDRRAAELDRREAELEALTARWAGQLERAKQNGNVQTAAQAIETDRTRLARAEKLLAAQQAEWEQLRRTLSAEQTTFYESMQAERQKLADDERRTSATHDRAMQAIKRQRGALAARQTALERTQAELARHQQEALEMRLATEQLWAQLCGSLAPAALAQSIAQIRLKLAEELRLAKSDLAAQRAEVQSLAAELAEQHEKLTCEREEVQSWVAARRRELENHAGLLAERERQLDRERQAMRDKLSDWQSERFRLQQELRGAGPDPTRSAA